MRVIMIAFMASIMAVGLHAAVRFSDRGDGTVKDNGTGLVWQKCSMGQGATDCSGTATTAEWQGALRYCRNLSLAGKSWRLPNVNELKSIVDYSVYDPAIDKSFFPNTVAVGSYYWSSTTNFATDKDYAWSIVFSSGYMISHWKIIASYVRCVADGP